MRVTIRPATADDVDAMVEAHARSWLAAYPGLLPEQLIATVIETKRERTGRWRARIADTTIRGATLVADVDGQVAGLVFTGPSRDDDAAGDTGEVWAIYLDPAVIGRGVGRALLTAAVEDLAGRGFAAATLWVLVSNARARRFYEAAGFCPDGATRTELRPDGRLDEVRYRRDLPGPGPG